MGGTGINLSLSHFLFLPFSFFLSLTFSHSLFLSFSHSLFLSLSFSLCIVHFLSLSPPSTKRLLTYARKAHLNQLAGRPLRHSAIIYKAYTQPYLSIPLYLSLSHFSSLSLSVVLFLSLFLSFSVTVVLFLCRSLSLFFSLSASHLEAAINPCWEGASQ